MTKLRRPNEAPCQRTAVGAQRHVVAGHEVVQVPEDLVTVEIVMGFAGAVTLTAMAPAIRVPNDPPMEWSY